MGSTTGDVNEAPVHTVELDAFYMDQHEVTNAEYKAFVTATGHPVPHGIGYTAVYELLKNDYEPWRDPDFNHPNQPVTTVTWFDAAAYWGMGRQTVADRSGMGKGSTAVVWKVHATRGAMPIQIAQPPTSLTAERNLSGGIPM